MSSRSQGQKGQAHAISSEDRGVLDREVADSADEGHPEDTPPNSTFAGRLNLASFAHNNAPDGVDNDAADDVKGKGKMPPTTGGTLAGASPLVDFGPTNRYSSPRTRSMKRKIEEANAGLETGAIPNTGPQPSAQKKTPPSSTQVRRARRTPQAASPTAPTTSNFRDTVSPGMILVFVGVNPGIQTGITGHSYAHPSNLYWKLLHESGITCQRHPPRDTYALPELYAIGNTNLVVRPTRDASGLTRAEMDEGAVEMQKKIAEARPEAVCMVGKGVWEAVWRANHGRQITKQEFKYGWQDPSENIGVDDGWDGSRVFVATTTSGLAAGMTPAEKLEVWKELGTWVKARRRDRKPMGTAGSAHLVD